MTPSRYSRHLVPSSPYLTDRVRASSASGATKARPPSLFLPPIISATPPTALPPASRAAKPPPPPATN
eukprot:12405204-Karenia_brevis.AAC.1